jgi:hypothetical protein
VGFGFLFGGKTPALGLATSQAHEEFKRSSLTRTPESDLEGARHPALGRARCLWSEVRWFMTFAESTPFRNVSQGVHVPHEGFTGNAAQCTSAHDWLAFCPVGEGRSPRLGFLSFLCEVMIKF